MSNYDSKKFWMETERKNEAAKKRHKDFVNKWWLWKNGLRFKIVPELDSYGEWIAENAKGHRWSVRPFVMVESEAKELTEAEAKLEYFEIENSTCYEGFCNCCSWKNGKDQIKVKMKLTQGKTPSDECDRLQDALRTFFHNQKVFTIVPYVRRTDDGVELQFISRTNPENLRVHEEKLLCEHCGKETDHKTRKFNGMRWFQKCTQCEWHMFQKTGKYEPPVGELPISVLEYTDE